MNEYKKIGDFYIKEFNFIYNSKLIIQYKIRNNSTIVSILLKTFYLSQIVLNETLYNTNYEFNLEETLKKTEEELKTYVNGANIS